MERQVIGLLTVGIALVLAIGACDSGPSPNIDELDGTKIAFVSDRDLNNADTMGNVEIYAMNADGSAQTRVTSGSAINLSPSWSPNGTKIAFHSSPGVVRNVMAPYKIDTMNADGSDRTRLTINPEDKHPSWSPDGTKIAFSSSSDQDERDGAYEIYVMNADGSSRTRLTDNSAMDLNPSGSPDGSMIAFSSDRDTRKGMWPGPSEIYVMDADGSKQTRLTDDLAYDGGPSWRPGRRKIESD